jgi:hypothetical protein
MLIEVREGYQIILCDNLEISHRGSGDPALFQIRYSNVFWNDWLCWLGKSFVVSPRLVILIRILPKGEVKISRKRDHISRHVALGPEAVILSSIEIDAEGLPVRRSSFTIRAFNEE